jgi:uncharacterized protein YbaP (TraB family)
MLSSSGGGSHFIVVGINHTVGPQSIQTELMKLGVSTHRL